MTGIALPGRPPGRAAADRVLSTFEFWPGWVFYAPVVAQWIYWLGLRYGRHEPADRGQSD